MNKTIIIAEIGECWNGDIEQAKKLIQVAAEAGCDYAKFQTLDIETVKDDDPERDWFLKVALSDEHIDFIIEYCNSNNIKPLFTPANLKKAKLLKNKFNMTEVKIASSVFHNIEAKEYIINNFETIFISTGMASLDQITDTVNKIDKNTKLYILHCVSEYPTGILLEERGLTALSEENVHLNMMLILKKMFPQYKIGYSDHTVGILAPVAAVAAGAEVIEKHITLDRKTPIENYKSKKEYLGTDHILSLEPDELKEMVSQIRRVEKMFSDWKWQRTEGEKKLRNFLVGRF